jgi:methionyl-tRNA formyltransferase
LDSFIKAYTDAGVTVDRKEKQMYQMVQAVDGVIFYMENQPVKIYEYKTEKDLENAVKKDERLKSWLSNGRFLLETNHEKAKEIFKNVK